MENAVVTLVTVFYVCAVSFGALYSIFARSGEQPEELKCSLVFAKIGR